MAPTALPKVAHRLLKYKLGRNSRVFANSPTLQQASEHGFFSMGWDPGSGCISLKNNHCVSGDESIEFPLLVFCIAV